MTTDLHFPTPPADVPMTGPTLVIGPGNRRGLIDAAELWSYRDLALFLIWRDVKARYAQSILGIGWAIIQPLFTMLVFTVVFGRVARVPSDGLPYSLFSFAALVPWTFFSTSLTAATDSLVTASAMISKVYFPRIILPITAVLGKGVDLAIALAMLAAMMGYYRIAPTRWAVIVPLLLVLAALAATGLGLWLTALAAQYRDVKYAVGLVVQLMMYAAPVVYPVSLIPARYRLAYAINPMVGVIEGMRTTLLRTGSVPWDLIVVGTVSALVFVVTGAAYFRRKEPTLTDVL
jgi:lipopolysaccharide transport system permease protein